MSQLSHYPQQLTLCYKRPLHLQHHSFQITFVRTIKQTHSIVPFHSHECKYMSSFAAHKGPYYDIHTLSPLLKNNSLRNIPSLLLQLLFHLLLLFLMDTRSNINSAIKQLLYILILFFSHSLLLCYSTILLLSIHPILYPPLSNG